MCRRKRRKGKDQTRKALKDWRKGRKEGRTDVQIDPNYGELEGGNICQFISIH